MVRDTSASSVALDVVIHLSLLLLLVCCLYPVLHVASVSLSSVSAVERAIVTFYPRDITVDAYRMALQSAVIPRAFGNSVLYTSLGTCIAMFFTTMFAYALSKRRLTFRRFYLVVMLVTMYFSGGLVPTFLIIRGLGMYNTIWALVLPGAVSVWSTIMMRTYFRTIPEGLEDSAQIDGANDFQILARIMVPVAKPMIAAMTLFAIVGYWNSWFEAMIYLKEVARYPLQLILREFVLENQLIEQMSKSNSGVPFNELEQGKRITVETLKYATLFISMVPMLVAYPFIQRHLVKGIMIGSLKD